MSGWQDFVQKWSRSKLNERKGSHEHFLDICNALGEESPATHDQNGESFTFEKYVSKTSGGKGFADVWKKGYFAWEYKGPHKDLNAAYQQLHDYCDDLENPPLLVVSDLHRFKIHVCWNASKPRTYEFQLSDLLRHEPTPTCPLPPQDVLRALFRDPEQLKRERVAEKVTSAAALRFSQLAERLELEGPHRLRAEGKADVARFLMRILFCLFADWVGLLPEHLFKKLVDDNRSDPKRFIKKLRLLFEAMASQDGTFGVHDISWFNGGLFDGTDRMFDLTHDDMNILAEVSRLDWSAVEPAIFGTLFERSLDARKRKSIGGHYTSRTDIEHLVEPIIIQPLRERWVQIMCSMGQLERASEGASLPQYKRIRKEIEAKLLGWIEELSAVTILDPACGSGNFLYVAMRSLLDLWLEAWRFAADRNIKTIIPNSVGPHQVYGIETDFYAHELSSIVVWIGYLQWRHDNGQGFEDRPVLRKLGNIRKADAILDYSAEGKPLEPEWPKVDYIVGNRPFLGDKKMLRSMPQQYVKDIRRLYRGRVPASADLVCYWFEKAAGHMDMGGVKRVGLIATQAIRGGKNRAVVDKIVQKYEIFFAVSDRDWVVGDANVHISMIGFDAHPQSEKWLDGKRVEQIFSDLSSSVPITKATPLEENDGIAFIGIQTGGKFQLSRDEGAFMLKAPRNANGRSNSEVIRPFVNGSNLRKSCEASFIIDFGIDMSEKEAAYFELPYAQIRKLVRPNRLKLRRRNHATQWWIHEEARPGLRKAISSLDRYIVAVRHASNRIYMWVDANALPDSALVAFARQDDYFFGVLHSKWHELWAFAKGTQVRDKASGFRYTPSSTFQTFPFPWRLGSENPSDPKVHAIASATRALVERRDAWLRPEEVSERELSKRTLSTLYSTRPHWLQNLHAELDRSVASAYGWPQDLSDDQILERLLQLNLERSRVESEVPKKPSTSVAMGMPRKTAIPIRRKG